MARDILAHLNGEPRCPFLFHGGFEESTERYSSDRCVLRQHGSDRPHRWPTGAVLRYQEGLDIVLVPDPLHDRWEHPEVEFHASRPPTPPPPTRWERIKYQHAQNVVYRLENPDV